MPAALECSWLPGQAAADLHADDVHLWLFHLEPWLTSWRELLPELLPGERRRALRFRYDRHRTRYVCARVLSRRILADYCGLPPHRLKYRFGELGKPFVVNPGRHHGIQFNTTDSGDFCLAAFTIGAELGVDIEALPRRVNHELLARRKFTRDEYETIMSYEDHRQAAAFLATWTRKEAYGKALGVGIRFSMESIPLGTDLSDPNLDIEMSGAAWRLVQPGLPVSALASLVVAARDWTLKCYRYDLEP